MLINSSLVLPCFNKKKNIPLLNQDFSEIYFKVTIDALIYSLKHRFF